MLERSDLQRSIGKMIIDLPRERERRKRAHDDYKLGVWEFQRQFEFAGKVGTLPVETVVKVPFAIIFMADPGNQSPSQHDRPHVKLSFEKLVGPAGLITYGHVDSWLLDPDFNYVGAKVKVGVHFPGLLVPGAMPKSFTFKCIGFASFQGFGAVIDTTSIQSTTSSTGTVFG